MLCIPLLASRRGLLLWAYCSGILLAFLAFTILLTKKVQNCTFFRFGAGRLIWGFYALLLLRWAWEGSVMDASQDMLSARDIARQTKK